MSDDSAEGKELRDRKIQDSSLGWMGINTHTGSEENLSGRRNYDWLMGTNTSGYSPPKSQASNSQSDDYRAVGIILAGLVELIRWGRQKTTALANQSKIKTNHVLLFGSAILFGTPLIYNLYSDYQDSVVTPYLLSVADKAPIATAVVKTNDYLYRDISRTPFTNPFAQGQRTGILLREGQTVEILERVNLGNSPFHAYIIRVTVSGRAPIIGYFDKEMLRNEQRISPAAPQQNQRQRQSYHLGPVRPEHSQLAVQHVALKIG